MREITTEQIRALSSTNLYKELPMNKIHGSEGERQKEFWIKHATSDKSEKCNCDESN